MRMLPRYRGLTSAQTNVEGATALLHYTSRYPYQLNYARLDLQTKNKQAHSIAKPVAFSIPGLPACHAGKSNDRGVKVPTYLDRFSDWSASRY